MAHRLIDLFSGAGGMSLGFREEGIEPILALDNDAAAVETHKLNFEGEAYCADIEQWLKTADVPEADVVIGGPPCQGFSLLNKKREGDSRRALWEPYLEIAHRSKSRIFVMENVAELLRSPELVEIRARAKGYGFETKAVIVNAADYGAPQTRKRTIVIGWRNVGEPDFPPRPTHADPNKNLNLPPWRTVRQAIGDLPKPVGTEIGVGPPIDLHFGRKPTALSIARYKAVPYGGNRFDLLRNAPELTPDCWVRKTSGGTDLFGRLWWDRPSVTIRTEFFKPEKGRYLHPVEDRPITHREAARLMGFPDHFRFYGTKTEVARQIGNAVPPPLAGALARMIVPMLAPLKRAPDRRAARAADKLDPERRSANMARVRGKDTDPEMRVRRVANRMGLRFRLHRKDLPGKPDLVFPKHRLAVFVHGCFWHRHPGCTRASMPSTRADFWRAKFDANVTRDARQQAALEALGWTVLVLWECELKEEAQIEGALEAAVRAGKRTGSSATDRLNVSFSATTQ